MLLFRNYCETLKIISPSQRKENKNKKWRESIFFFSWALVILRWWSGRIRLLDGWSLSSGSRPLFSWLDSRKTRSRKMRWRRSQKKRRQTSRQSRRRKSRKTSRRSNRKTCSRKTRTLALRRTALYPRPPLYLYDGKVGEYCRWCWYVDFGLNVPFGEIIQALKCKFRNGIC